MTTLTRQHYVEKDSSHKYIIRKDGEHLLPFCVYYISSDSTEFLECEAISLSEALDYISEQKE